MSDSFQLYPWQLSTWQRLYELRSRLPHAILLHGPSGTGKQAFVDAWVRSLLCQSLTKEGHACGDCISCKWMEQDHHPDYRFIEPEQEDNESGTKRSTKKKQISVQQIRDLADFIELSSHRHGGRRVAIISPAESLNMSSANALLKMLEEPPNNMMFVMVADNAQKLLPTILSRCHKIEMPLPTEEQALSWLTQQNLIEKEAMLAYVGGAPLSAISPEEPSYKDVSYLAQELSKGQYADTFAIASWLSAFGMGTAITMLQKWIYDLVSIRLISDVRYHIKCMTTLQSLSKSVDFSRLMEFQKTLTEAKKSAFHPLNNELQLENILLQYRQLFK